VALLGMTGCHNYNIIRNVALEKNKVKIKLNRNIKKLKTNTK